MRYLILLGLIFCFFNQAFSADITSEPKNELHNGESSNATEMRSEAIRSAAMRDGSAHSSSMADGKEDKITEMPKNLSANDVQFLPYERPKGFDWLTESPGNLVSFVKRIRPKENVWWLTGIGLSTAVLIKYDQAILDESQRFARRLGLISDTKTGRETYTIIDWSVGDYDLPFVIPKNLNSVMYFIGDGLPQIGIIGGLTSYGLMNDDSKALSTASQTLEALFVTGIVVQVLKRTTGREAGFKATQSGGKWQYFPNQIEYSKNVPKYDAFPSGHLATVMASTTVLAENYPDHGYIRPVGYTLMTLLGFAMMNNGVHWAGDYPVGIAIGYTAARVAVERNRKQRWLKANKPESVSQMKFNTVVPFAKADALGFSYISNF